MYASALILLANEIVSAFNNVGWLGSLLVMARSSNSRLDDHEFGSQSPSYRTTT